MPTIKMNNAAQLYDRETAFDFRKLGNYVLVYKDFQTKSNSEEINLFEYQIKGSFKPHHIFVSAYKNIKFVEDTKENKELLIKLNDTFVKCIKQKDLLFKDFSKVYELVDKLEFSESFRHTEDSVTIPDEIEILSVLPKFNSREPIDSTRLRYKTSAYKSINYVETNSGFEQTDKGESIPVIARRLREAGEWEVIDNLYDTVEINNKMVKPENLIYNVAIAIATYN